MASVCRMPTDAVELWITAVTSAPVRIPRIGFLPIIANACAKIGASVYGAMEPLINSRPTNRRPTPLTISPIRFIFCFLENTIMKLPIPIHRGAKKDGWRTENASPS